MSHQFLKDPSAESRISTKLSQSCFFKPPKILPYFHEKRTFTFFILKTPDYLHEPMHGKTYNLHRRKQRRRSAVTAKLISTFVFATRIAQFQRNCWTRSETHIDGFLMHRLISIMAKPLCYCGDACIHNACTFSYCLCTLHLYTRFLQCRLMQHNKTHDKMQHDDLKHGLQGFNLQPRVHCLAVGICKIDIVLVVCCSSIDQASKIQPMYSILSHVM